MSNDRLADGTEHAQSSQQTPHEQWQMAQEIQFTKLDEPLCNYCARGANVLLFDVPFCSGACCRDWLKETFNLGEGK